MCYTITSPFPGGKRTIDTSHAPIDQLIELSHGQNGFKDMFKYTLFLPALQPVVTFVSKFASANLL